MKDDLVKAAKQLGATLLEEGKKTGQVALELGRDAVQTDTFQDAAKGAAAGAVIAVPIPIIGPITGAIVGAAAGVAAGKKLRGSEASGGSAARQLDLHTELVKLDDLRQRGLLTEDEFQAQKRKLLRS